MFQEVSESPMTDREQALAEIREIIGAEEFESWYNKTYELRKAGKHDEYEAEIFMKLEKLQNAMSDVLDARICAKHGVSL